MPPKGNWGPLREGIDAGVSKKIKFLFLTNPHPI